MIRSFVSVHFTFFLILTATCAHARGFQLTPFVGYRLGGDFEDAETKEEIELGDAASYGIILNVDYEENTELEFLYGYQGTELKPDDLFAGESYIGLGVHYLHLGGTYFWDYDWAKPFVASTIGVTLFDPHPGGLDSEVRFSLSIGGGVKLFASDRLGFRLEGRGFGTFFDGGGAVFCGDGGCTAFIESEVLVQFEFRAGVIVAF